MSKETLALDLGSSNSVTARWNRMSGAPEILRLEGICRERREGMMIDDSATIPSAVFLRPPAEVLGWPARWFFSHFKHYTGAWVGKQALDADGGRFGSTLISGFKSALGEGGYRILGRLREWTYTPEEVARLYLRGILRSVKVQYGIRARELVITVPTDFYEVYRARLRTLSAGLGIPKIRTLDEPVAAALGYGLTVENEKLVLVVDFGAGTLDLALIRFDEKNVERGRAEVLAKIGVAVGGTRVDNWILEEMCDHYGYSFEQLLADTSNHWWYRMLLDEARRIKEGLFIEDKQTFYLMPSGLMNPYRTQLLTSRVKPQPLDYTKDALEYLLERRGLYKLLSEQTDAVLKQVKGREVPDEVLLVGGSTLLPGVYSIFEERFGRDRVRAWQPFHAVAFGAAAYAAGQIEKSDFITHDYAFLTYDRQTREPQYHRVVNRGTRFPTAREHWRRQLVPTCALGEPEKIFKLQIFEIGRKHSQEAEYIWDEKGKLHILNEQEEQVEEIRVPLNAGDPILGYLDPPHFPSEKSARIDLSFWVNEEKWLCATVRDLKTGRLLMENRAVVRVK